MRNRVLIAAVIMFGAVGCDSPVSPAEGPPSQMSVGAHVASTPGKILVNHDEWTLSNDGFSSAPDAAQFARNVANWFTGGSPGAFLVYSDNHGVADSELANTMLGAGHTWTISTAIPFTLANLLPYNAVFLAGVPADNAVLIEYVEAGGSVYLAGGTGRSPDEASAWNVFLHHFGLDYADFYNTVSGLLPITSTHRLFAGVSALYYLEGTSVRELAPANPSTDILESSAAGGMFGVFEAAPVVPPVGDEDEDEGDVEDEDRLRVEIDIKPGSGRKCINDNGHGVIPVAVLGSASFDVRQIDVRTVELEGLDVRAVGKKRKLKAHIEDVNKDGFKDLMLQIEKVSGTFASGSGTATLTGLLLDGIEFYGTDTTCIVP